MTLIINEIHIELEKNKSYIVACADRRITRKNTSKKEKYETNKKLFGINYLNACLSYWGNITVKGETGNYETLSSWLPNFIKKNADIKTLSEFSMKLRNTLNQKMHSDHLREYASGFHLSGFDSNNNPEFHHFSNTNWIPENGKYTNTTFKYKEPFSDFAEKDYKNFFTGEGIDWNNLKATDNSTYRNGDFAVHVAAWDKLDKAFDEIFRQDNFKFKKSRDNENLIKYYKFKLKFIGDIYQKWGHTKNVGGPFDIIILRPK